MPIEKDIITRNLHTVIIFLDDQVFFIIYSICGENGQARLLVVKLKTGR